MPRRPPNQEERGNYDDLAALLPIFGAVLLTPAMANLFHTGTSLFGLPLDMLYVFAVWILLIAGAWWLSRRLPQITPPDDPSQDLKVPPELPSADSRSE